MSKENKNKGYILPPEVIIRMGLEEACPFSIEERIKMGDTNRLLKKVTGAEKNQGKK